MVNSFFKVSGNGGAWVLLRGTVHLLALLAIALICGCGSQGQTGTDGGCQGQTITGTLLAQDGGSFAGLSIAVLSGSTLQQVTPNSDGSFTLCAVTIPYDAMVVDASSHSTNIFQGLTVLHPELTVPLQLLILPAGHLATLTGSVTPGPGITLTQDELLYCVLETEGTPYNVPAGVGSLSAATRDFQTTLVWNGPATLTGDLYVLSRYGVPPSPPALVGTTVWTGLAMLPRTTVSDGVTGMGLDAGLQPIASTTVSGTLTSPAGFDAVSLYAFLVAKPMTGRTFSLPVENKDFLSTTNFALDVPELPGIPLQLQGGGITDAGTQFLFTQNLTSFDAGIDISVPEPATLEAPADRAALQRASAIFRWSAVTGASLYALQVMELTGEGIVTLYTNQTTATLPDVSRVGLPPLTVAGWSVSSFASPASIDELAGDAGLGVLLLGNQLETSSVRGSVVFQ